MCPPPIPFDYPAHAFRCPKEPLQPDLKVKRSFDFRLTQLKIVRSGHRLIFSDRSVFYTVFEQRYCFFSHKRLRSLTPSLDFKTICIFPKIGDFFSQEITCHSLNFSGRAYIKNRKPTFFQKYNFKPHFRLYFFSRD